MHPPVCVYRIDHQDRIQQVNDVWTDFAIANQWPLRRGALLGKSLWDFLASESVRSIYAALHEVVRRRHTSYSFQFRCDSAVLRRFMKLEMIPVDKNGIEYRTWVEKEEPRAAVPVVDPRVPRSEEQVLMCSWCKRVKTEDGWREVEEAIESLGCFGSEVMPHVQHDICEACFQLATTGGVAETGN